MISNKHIVMLFLVCGFISGCSGYKGLKTQYYKFEPSYKNILYIENKYKSEEYKDKIKISIPFKFKESFKGINKKDITYHTDIDNMLYMKIENQDYCTPSIQDVNKMNVFGVDNVITSCFADDIRELSKVGDKNAKL